MNNTHPISIAPMMDWTDRHFRYFLRLITNKALLYTEMITSSAILHGDAKRLLQFNGTEHPVALQLGGSHPDELRKCTAIAEDFGYDQINLNVGCPSDRVQSGKFGACLMMEPELVAECVSAMREVAAVPVTVKCRIGVDDYDTYSDLQKFVAAVANTGCDTVIIHARKAWLQGLSPKENREIPPLQYDTVYKIKSDFPALTVVINGGIKTLQQAKEQLHHVDGVMIGREAYHNPYLLVEADTLFYADDHPIPSRHAVVEQFIPYAEQQLALGVPLNSMTRHLLGLFQGVPGARAWRRHLSEHAHKKNAGINILRDAARLVTEQRAA